MALNSLGECLWYLQHRLLDKHVLALATLKIYVPPDENVKVPLVKKQNSMVLDSITLSHCVI
jgi:hypothetical protein